MDIELASDGRQWEAIGLGVAAEAQQQLREIVSSSNAGQLPPGVVRVQTPRDEPEPPTIARPYKRPAGATTREQRAAVQGQPCVDCGRIDPVQVANHKVPLVKAYYRTVTLNIAEVRSPSAVVPHCMTCSRVEGANMSRYSIKMRRLHGFEE